MGMYIEINFYVCVGVPQLKKIKAKHLKPGGLNQSIEIPTLKLEAINTDILVGLTRTRILHDSIWIIVDRITESTPLHMCEVFLQV